MSFSQQMTLQILPKNAENMSVLKSISYKKKQDNIKQLKLELNSILKKLSEKGFLKSTIDSTFLKDSVYTAVIDVGTPIKYINISYTQIIEEGLLKKYSLNYNTNTALFKWSSIKPFLDKLLAYYQKNGNAFAKIRLKNIHLDKHKAFAILEITKNKQRYIDSVVIKGYSKFPESFINYYLGLRKNTLFDATKLKSISARLKALKFVDEIKSPEILFTKSKTKVYLYLKKKNANTFDGLIGFSSKEQGNGLVFNGYLDINLKNALNTGETISLLYKSNGDNKQKFNLKAILPYAFKSKITPSIDFNIYKQDTSFVNVGVKVGAKYPFSYNSSIGVLLNIESSSNLLTQQNPLVKSYNSFYGGLTYTYTSLSHKETHNTFNFETNILKGSKTFQDKRENQFKLNVLTSYLWQLTYKSAVFIKNQTGYLNTDNYVVNELYRIGGFNSIRGFDEESIFASYFSTFNIEYRYKTNEDDYLYSVSDFANYSNALLNVNKNLYSFGLGYQFLSKIGFINLSYVFGKVSNKDFNFKNGQLHFSIKANF